jgi:hypothetical protein
MDGMIHCLDKLLLSKTNTLKKFIFSGEKNHEEQTMVIDSANIY